MKKIIGMYSAIQRHGVGDDFPVRSLFTYHSHDKIRSSFLLLDQGKSTGFPLAAESQGVAQNPHRGIETVTIIYKRKFAHQAAASEGSMIDPDNVQWVMTASGILHEEFHSETFIRSGGTLDMVQLWINLPMRDKVGAPAYQAILDDAIPTVTLAGNAGTVHVIAGSYAGCNGPAQTFSPMNAWDVRLNAGKHIKLPAAEGWNTLVMVLHGTVQVNGQSTAREAQMVLLDHSGSNFTLKANSDAVLLLLSDKPANEPIIGTGSTQDAITGLNGESAGKIIH